MPYIKQTIRNPYGLSVKQRLVINDVVDDILHGRGMDHAQSTQKFYKVKNRKGAAEIARQNWNRLAFMQAFNDKLRQVNLNGKIATALGEGLDAVDSMGYIDHGTRLDYIKEINKITGAYPNQ